MPELKRRRFASLCFYETPLALGLPRANDRPVDETADGSSLTSVWSPISITLPIRFGTNAICEWEASRSSRPVRDMVNRGRRLSAFGLQRGVDLHLIAMSCTAAPERSIALVKRHFQSITAYNMYYRPKFPEAAATIQPSIERHALMDALGSERMPGYDDTRRRGTERVTINRRRGQFFRDY